MRLTFDDARRWLYSLPAEDEVAKLVRGSSSSETVVLTTFLAGAEEQFYRVFPRMRQREGGFPADRIAWQLETRREEDETWRGLSPTSR